MSEDDARPTTARTLAVVLRTDPPSTGEAVRLAARVADEVASLHAAGRAHGALDPGAVLVEDGGEVRLTGGSPERGRPAAPLGTRLADVRGVGRILALGLGFAGSTDVLPVRVDRLVAAAEDSDAPACTLALALQRLEHDPDEVARLLPSPIPATRDAAAADGVLAGLVPRAERRVTGAAAVVVGGATALGIALLLGGAPAGSTGIPPTAASSSAAPAEEAPPQALAPGVVAAAADDRDAVQEVLSGPDRSSSVLAQPAAPQTAATRPDVPASTTPRTDPGSTPTPTGSAPTGPTPTAPTTPAPGSGGSPDPEPTATPPVEPTAPTEAPTPAPQNPSPTSAPPAEQPSSTPASQSAAPSAGTPAPTPTRAPTAAVVAAG